MLKVRSNANPRHVVVHLKTNDEISTNNLTLAIIKLIIQLLGNRNYGFHRDELQRQIHLLDFPLFAILLLFVSCQGETKMDTEFYIPVEKSNLYVRLVGNANGPLLINLHGGPGAFSGFAHEFNRKYLEDDYLIAYLDQRGGGKSNVCTDSTMLTMKQFIEDLDVVVDTLQ